MCVQIKDTGKHKDVLAEAVYMHVCAYMHVCCEQGVGISDAQKWLSLPSAGHHAHMQ